MLRKTVFAIMLGFLITSTLTMAFRIESVKAATMTSSVPPGGGGSPPPRPGSPVYFSMEPVALDSLTNVNTSINGLEIPSSPSPLGQNFTVEIHLRNATLTNAPAGVFGVYVDFDFTNILGYCKPIAFATMLGQPGGALTGSLVYAVNGGFYDLNGNPVGAVDYSQATQYAVMAATTANAGWNDDDGLVAQVTFQITRQPYGAAFYSQLQISYAELAGFKVSANEIPYSIVQGTLKIDALNTILGDLNNDGKVGLDDLLIFAAAYRSRPGDPNWNPLADVATPYGVINLVDMVTLAMHYGQHSP